MVETPVKRANPLVLSVPLVVFALVTVTVGIIAQHTAAVQAGIVCTQTSAYTSTCTNTPFFHLFFSDPIHLKVWLASGAFVLGLFQVLSALRIYGKVRLPGGERAWGFAHRWSGRTAIVLTLPVAYHCIFLLGFQTLTPRVFIHSLLGSACYGIFLGKVWIVRAKGFPGWALPVAGGLLFAVLLGLWTTSAGWFFSQHGFGF